MNIPAFLIYFAGGTLVLYVVLTAGQHYLGKRRKNRHRWDNWFWRPPK